MRDIALLLALFCFPTFAATAMERHALVIGNSNYEGGALVNPVNDANDMADQLSVMGYKIHGGGPALDLDRIGIERTVRAFAQQLPKDAHALFYYAGHGMATKQDNYLIPVGHSLEYQEQLPDKTVSLRSVVNLFKNANPGGINIVLLDACRDNPLGNSFRSTRTGLSRLVDIPRGVFIGYAADSGQVAEDGFGRNGTYTAELLNVMREKPNVIIEIAHKDIATRVYEKTDGKQFPVSENKVYGNWCFGECTAPVQSTLSSPVANPLETPVEAPVVPPVTPTPKKGSKRWMIVGGVVVAAVVAGLALRDTDPGPSGTNTFTLELTPP